MVKAYINGTGCISAQNTISESWFFETITPPNVDYYNAIEPSYKDYIAPNLLRRMGRAIKMGVTAASVALKNADVKEVDAIITGTGLGCFEDSERFLLALLNNDEQFLTPTSFIQSTHNTVGSQIALIMKCHHYNYTYVHRGFSFESCLQDALMLFNEGKKTILIGGVEEHTPNYICLLRRAKKFQEQDSSVAYWNSKTPGTQMGEGASFFVLSTLKTEKSMACIDGIQTFYKPKTVDDILTKLNAFLKLHHLNLSDIDVTLMGFSLDVNFDEKLQKLLPIIEKESCPAYYKHLSGEYHTSSAFALWLAAQLIEKQILPKAISISQKTPTSIKRILIINQYLGINYSFMLVSHV
ncbi:MAG: beta-ketoacyl synthase chain length factor [Bacteroidota bacterium]